MNFNPNAMMQKQVEKMISQRFGSVDNMMNDMSKFAGNNPTLKNALDLYKKGDTDQLHQIQSIPEATTINAPVVIQIGAGTILYPLQNRCCAQVTACGVRTRTKYATRVATNATGGVFKMLGNPACSPSNNLTAINGTAPTADTPVTQAVRKGAL